MINSLNNNTYFAHRGLPQYAENSQEGFINANKLGYNALEVDVQITKDKRLILFHDKNANRLLGINKNIDQLEWKEINNALLIHKGKKTSNNPILLEHLLLNNYEMNTVYLDVKSSKKIIADSLVFLLNKHKSHQNFLVADANLLFLAYLKFKNPEIQTVLEGFNKGKEWIYYLIPNQFKPNYWASFYSEVNQKHIKFLEDNQLLNRKIVYGLNNREINDAKNKKLKHFIVDFIY